jgi:hypothetical protein
VSKPVLDIEELEKAAAHVPCRDSGRWYVVPTERVWPSGKRGVQLVVNEADYPDIEEWPIFEVDPGGQLAPESAEPIARYLALLHPAAIRALCREFRDHEAIRSGFRLGQALKERDEARAEVTRLKAGFDLLRAFCTGMRSTPTGEALANAIEACFPEESSCPPR